MRRVLKPKPRPKKKRLSKLDPFQPLVRKLVLEDGLTCVRVFEELRGVGYDGGYTILKDFVRSIRPRPARRPHERFETGPGEQAQVDLSQYKLLLGQALTPVVCFSMIFCFSRWHFIYFLLHADVYSICHCHVMAFEEAGGVPWTILYDRMKQVVLESFKEGVVFQSLFERLMGHYGFRAIPLPPGYCEGKGKVEKPFQYIESNFLAGRVFHDLDDLNAQAKAWRDEKAQRIHRTTRERPAARLDQERPKLLKLPPERFDAARCEPRIVGDDYCVAWETNRYSVWPNLVGKQAWVRVLLGRLQVLVGDEVVAEHRLGTGRFQRYVLPEHEAAFYQRSRSSHVLSERFSRLGSVAAAFENGLRKEKHSAAGYHMSRILALAGRVGVARVTEALRHATRYQAFDSRAVERIVTGRILRRASGSRRPEEALSEKTVEYLKGAGEFQRGLDAYQKWVSPSLRRRLDDDQEEAPDGQ